MAHYAFLDENNVVTEVITGRDEDDLIDGVTSWEEYYGAFRGQRCVQTSYNTRAGVHAEGGEPFRGNYAGVGYTYDEERDAFIPPQPFPSWSLNEETFLWESPTPYPSTPGLFAWSEQDGAWVQV
jgi:hypothetical protein